MTSPLQDAFMEGQRAGQLGLGAGLNPHDPGTPQHAEWERARNAAEARRLSSDLRNRAQRTPAVCRRTGETCDCQGRGLCRDVA